MNRAVLIAFQGCDRVGKSTHVKLLNTALNHLTLPSSAFRFPDRTTRTGLIIDSYLKGKLQLQEQAVSQLFVENRRQKAMAIESLSLTNKFIILDRYTYSGVAYAMARGSRSETALLMEKGLPKPDLVLLLHLPVLQLSSRSEFGKQKFQNQDFQNKVKESYEQLLKSQKVIRIETSRAVQEVHKQILDSVVNMRASGPMNFF